jgi:FixJ family two-component response regulator
VERLECGLSCLTAAEPRIVDISRLIRLPFFDESSCCRLVYQYPITGTRSRAIVLWSGCSQLNSDLAIAKNRIDALRITSVAAQVCMELAWGYFILPTHPVGGLGSRRTIDGNALHQGAIDAPPRTVVSYCACEREMSEVQPRRSLNQTNLARPSAMSDGPRESASVAIVDDDERFREALGFQLQTADFKVDTYRSAEGFLEASRATQFDCVVADICLPRLNGLQLLAQIKESTPFASIVVITGQGNLSLGVQAMREGAVDCLEKPIDDASLLWAVKRGIELFRLNRAAHLRRMELVKREQTLTPREREVFALIVSGMLNKQIGAELGPSEQTVKKHRARVMSKMGAASLADLVRMAETLRIDSLRVAA